MRFFIVIFLCIVTRMVNARPTTLRTKDHDDYNAMENYLWNMSTATAADDVPPFSNDELEEILNNMQLPANVSTFDYGDSADMISNYSQHGFVIIWRNPYLSFSENNNSESMMLRRDGGEDDEDDRSPHPPKHEFDEMEQRDFLRTVIFLANQQLRIKFHLCEMRRFRSHYIRRWNLYRCSARFTVARLGKDCDPNKTYDGYVNFIVQNPELPPLLAIRYYVFQFLYESSLALVNKMNDHVSLSSMPNQLESNGEILLQPSSDHIHHPI
ncbi:hypothetical protein BLA29_007481 [Euroglyphus maynei]|uniref:Uncharacterized protein n=1 Tax=Euroglyphus maynei TaxID=6958 RepID=A0A1Y3AZ78_EURMA|nr:hypothetical protein BLA29_007481 [Euroglyphus maynei]